jgi:hypothetical protein
MGCIAPRKIALVELKDQMKQPASKEQLDKELSFPRSVYSQKNIPENINIKTAYEDLSSIIDWGFK